MIQSWISAILSGALPPEPTTSLLTEIMRSSVQSNVLAKAFFETSSDPHNPNDVRVELLGKILDGLTR